MSLGLDLKELIRHSITKLGLSGLHLRVRKARGQNVDHLLRPTLAERFAAVYKNRVWLEGRPAGALSGFGSELANTEGIRRVLPPLLIELNTKTLLDVGCGDFTWMQEVQLPCRYIGVDIVTDLVKRNTALYGSEQRSFQALDATRDALPSADTILCREILFHLSFEDIWRLTANIRRSNASFLIATNDSLLRANADIISGDFRLLNLHKSPFFFPKPEAVIPDNAVAQDRALLVWKVSALPEGPKIRTE